MVQSLAKFMFQAKLKRGGADCRLFSLTGKPESLLYQQRWATPQTPDVQSRPQRFGTLLGIMAGASHAPDLEVRTVSEQRGLDPVTRLRLPAPGMTSTETGHATIIKAPP